MMGDRDRAVLSRARKAVQSVQRDKDTARVAAVMVLKD